MDVGPRATPHLTRSRRNGHATSWFSGDDPGIEPHRCRVTDGRMGAADRAAGREVPEGERARGAPRFPSRDGHTLRGPRYDSGRAVPRLRPRWKTRELPLHDPPE